MDGDELSSPINSDAMKKYYAWVALVKKNERKRMKEKRNENKEESKLKIWKGRFGFNGGYSSWKLVKDDLGKGKKPQKAIQSMKSSHQMVEVESKVLFGRMKIVGHVCLLKEGSGS